MNEQHFALAPDGWELRGFVGSDSELKRQLLYGHEAEVTRHVLLGRPPQVGLFAKLLTDSGQRAVAETISDFTGKAEYHFGDLSKAAIRKLSEGVSTGVSEFTGKKEYHFGDISKAAIAKLGSIFSKGDDRKMSQKSVFLDEQSYRHEADFHDRVAQEWLPDNERTCSADVEVVQADRSTPNQSSA